MHSPRFWIGVDATERMNNFFIRPFHGFKIYRTAVLYKIALSLLRVRLFSSRSCAPPRAAGGVGGAQQP